MGNCRQVAIANTPVHAKAVSSVCCNAPPYVVDGAGDASVGDCKGARTVGARAEPASDRAVTVAQLGMASSSLASSASDCTTPPLLML